MKQRKCTSASGRHKWGWTHNKIVSAGYGGSLKLSSKGVYRCEICGAVRIGEPGAMSPVQYLDRNIHTLMEVAGGKTFGAGYVQRACGVGYNQAVDTMVRAVALGKATTVDGLSWEMPSAAYPDAVSNSRLECNNCDWVGSIADAVALGELYPLCPECHETTTPSVQEITPNET